MKITDEEIQQSADIASQQDWEDPKFKIVCFDAFVQGANWLRDTICWKPIKFAPKDGTCIIVSDETSMYFAKWGNLKVCSIKGWLYAESEESFDYLEITPTYFMSCPEYPK